MYIIDKVKRAVWIVYVIGWFALCSGTSHATIITTGCADQSTCTLNELFAGGTLEVSNGYSGVLFHDFLQEQLQATVPVDISLITVTGLDTGNMGFQINSNSQLSIKNTDFIALNIGYKVECLGHECIDNELLING